MSIDREFAEPSIDWVERMVEIDEMLWSGTRPLGAKIGTEFPQIQKLLSDLQTMHAPTVSAVQRQHPAGVPERIGHYEVRRMLGAGGGAVDYLAYDPRLQRDVAVKIPLPPGLLNEDARKRFVQEARLAAQLDHPHIVPAYEAGEDGPVPFIAYAYCSGPTLAEWIRNHGPMEPRAAAALLVQLADAVDYGHQRGILHRDLKPANVLLFPKGQRAHSDFPFTPRLSDFGLAKLMETVTTDTRSSMILATPLYMAPEQIGSARTHSIAATDVYGLGGILYEILSGRAPFAGETVIQVLETIRNGRVEKLSEVKSEIPKDLTTICEKALAVLPGDRYQSAAEFRDDLNRFLKGERISGRPLGVAAVAFRRLTAPARIAEASGFVILSFAAMGIWMILWPLGTELEIYTSASMPRQEMLGYTLPLLVNVLLGISLGWQIGKGKQWAAAVITILGSVLCLIVVAVLAQWMSPFYPTVYADTRTRELVYLYLLCQFAFQAFFAACAWLAIRRRSRL